MELGAHGARWSGLGSAVPHDEANYGHEEQRGAHDGRVAESHEGCADGWILQRENQRMSMRGRESGKCMTEVGAVALIMRERQHMQVRGVEVGLVDPRANQ